MGCVTSPHLAGVAADRHYCKTKNGKALYCAADIFLFNKERKLMVIKLYAHQCMNIKAYNAKPSQPHQ